MGRSRRPANCWWNFSATSARGAALRLVLSVGRHPRLHADFTAERALAVLLHRHRDRLDLPPVVEVADPEPVLARPRHRDVSVTRRLRLLGTHADGIPPALP